MRATEAVALRKVRTPGDHESHHTELSSTEPRMESDRCCFLSPEFLGFREGKRRPGGSGRERGIPGPRGERVKFWGLREGEKNPAASERKRGIPEDQEERVENPFSPWPVTVLVAALDLASASFTAQCVGHAIFCVWEKVCIYIHMCVIYICIILHVMYIMHI